MNKHKSIELNFKPLCNLFLGLLLILLNVNVYSQCSNCDSYNGTTTGPTSVPVGTNASYSRSISCSGGSPYQFGYCISGGSYTVISGGSTNITVQFNTCGTYNIGFNQTCSGGGELVCSAGLIVNVTGPISPSGSGGNTTICQGSIFTFPARSCTASSIRWYLNSSGTGPYYTGSVSPNGTTTYYPFCFQGCLSSAGNPVTVTEVIPQNANNTTSTASICETDTKSLTTTTPGGTWSVVSGGGSITGATYTPANISSNTNVTIRYTIPVNGSCPANSSDVTFTVNDNNPANNTTNNAPICEDDNKSLTASTSGGTWSIVSGGGSIIGTTYIPDDITANTNVTIRYTIPANGSCPATTSDVTFTVNPNVVANNTTSNAAICENSNKPLTTSTPGGTWSVVSGGGSITGATYTPANISSNTNVIIRYTIPVNGSCPASTSDVFFIVNPNFVANNTTTSNTICEDTNKPLTASPSGGSWSIVSGGGQISGTTYTPANIITNTSVIVRYTMPANGSCPASNNDVAYIVEPKFIPNITSSNSQMCNGDKRKLIGSPTGGTWNIVSGPGTIGINDSLIVSGNGNVVVNYSFNNICGYVESTQTINVTNSVLVDIANTETSLCQLEDLVLIGNPNAGSWSVIMGQGSLNTNTFTPTSFGNISLVYMVTNLCGSGTDTLNLNINPLPNTNSGNDQTICLGDSVELTATGNGTYSWVPGDNNQVQTVSPSMTTQYNLSTISDSGCISKDSVIVYIQVPDTAIANEDEATVINGLEEIIDIYSNDVGNVNSILILDGPFNGEATINNGTLLYTSKSGYIGKDSILYRICDDACNTKCDSNWLDIEVEGDIFVPELFSPNGDLFNDLLIIKGLNRYPNNELKVYNRWGEIVYSASPYLNDWNGKSNISNSMVPVGTYFILLKLDDTTPPINKFLELRR